MVNETENQQLARRIAPSGYAAWQSQGDGATVEFEGRTYTIHGDGEDRFLIRHGGEYIYGFKRNPTPAPAVPDPRYTMPEPPKTLSEGMPKAAPPAPPPPPSAPRQRRQPDQADGRRYIRPSDVFATAKQFGMDQWQTPEGFRTAHHHRGEFFLSNGAAFQAVDIETIKALLWPWLAASWSRTPDGEAKAVLPKRDMVGEIIEALRAASQLNNELEPPLWISQSIYAPRDLIVCKNTMIHWPSGHLVANTPTFFTTNALDFDYLPECGSQPVEFLKFLRTLWADDNESIGTLQEIFGLFLIPDTSFQKIILLVGPMRSGKGTIARILQKMIGVRNVCAPTLSSLGGNFGLQPLLHKTAAVIGDARIGPKSDTAAIAERLLSISGEDMITVERKFLGAWHGQLGIRFMIISNELPKFSDVSGALASRFVILSLTRSFLGHEDLGLFDRLLPELPEILNWSIAGLKRLKERGYFVMPSASREQMQELDTLASPMKAFLRDAYEKTDSGRGVLVDDFCDAWRRWCETNGRDHPGTNQSIGLALRTAWPHVSTHQFRSGTADASGVKSRERWFVGLQPRQG
jgi:putative DNA primase/helicase